MKAIDVAKKLLEAPDADVVVLLDKEHETDPASYSEVVIEVDVCAEQNIAILVLKDKETKCGTR